MARNIEPTISKSRSNLVIIGCIFLFLMAGTSLLLFYPFPSKDKTAYSKLDHPIVSNSKIYQDGALVDNNIVYFPLSYIHDNIDKDIILDQKSNSIILTTKDKVYQMPSESLTYFVNEEPHELEFPIYKTENRIAYISIDPFLTLYQLSYEYDEKTGITIVKKDGETVQTATIKPNQKDYHLALRSKPTLTSPFVSKVSSNEKVFIEKEESEYFLIRKENGVAGFIKKKIVKADTPEKLVIKRAEKAIPPLQAQSFPINLTWEAVYTENPNTSKIPEMPGVNVISPTWFSLKNGNGDLNNLGSLAYAEWAKSKNYQIWGLFSNDFDPDKTHEAFKNFETRKKVIRQLLEYSEMYHLDGINFDIENVYEEDGALVTQFVKEATPYLHEAGLVVSMDITVISNSGTWSKFYDRKKLAGVVDYMVVMAYDEYWATSPIAGSVASLPWVEENLLKLLEMIPNDRLILGVPLYTRLWKEADTEGGNSEVSSKAYSMNGINEWITQRKLTPVYDENTGQDYIEYRDEQEKATYKIWLENEKSLNKRIQLVHKYELAGVASWSRYFSNDQAWTVMSQSLQDTKTGKQ